MVNGFLYRIKSCFCVLIILLQFFPGGPAEAKFLILDNPFDTLSVIALRTNDDINIDGMLNEPAWMSSKVYNRFIQREPAEGNPVSEKTVLMILFDNDNLYIGMTCLDANSNLIVANEMRRDNLLLDNDAVEIFVDTYHDHRNAFYFSTNALGAKMDGIISSILPFEQQNWDWDGIWDCASVITDSGWTAEIIIPFKTLRYPDRHEHLWGINVSRIIPRKREEAYLFPVSRELGMYGFYHAEIYGHLKGINSITQPDKFHIKPFALNGLQRDFDEEKLYQAKLEAGFDAKYLLSSNLTLDLTVNTDFAQVEADQEQVNLTRFELFFPEKREFFLEGAGTFNFSEKQLFTTFPQSSLFFSRRIGLSEDNEIIPIIGGVKLTGRIDEFQLGVLNVLTNRTSYINDDDEHVAIPVLNFSAVRVKKDVLSNSYIGFIGLNKESMDNNAFNRAIGADANIFLSEKIQLSGFAAKTFSPEYQNADYAFSGDFLYTSDLFSVYASQNIIDENFNPEMGFVSRTGIRTSRLNFAYSPRPDFWNMRQIYFFSDIYYYVKQDNRLESRPIVAGFWTIFQSGAYIVAALSSNYEFLDEEFEIHDDVIIQPDIYSFNNFYGEVQSDLSRPVSFKLVYNGGGFFDGDIASYAADANFKAGNSTTLSLSYSYNDVHLSAGNFNTHLLGLRFIYTFSPKMFTKAFIQWNSQEDVIIGNFLFNLIHTPGSDLYIVYNEELDTTGENISTKNRTLLIKFTYLLSF